MRKGPLIRLSSLLERHERTHPQDGLPLSLGDPFLCAKNRVVARIRHATLALGFKLSRRPTPLWQAYQVLPLLCLKELLARRTIPYIDNVTPLRHLAGQRPGLDLSESFLLANLRRNFILHESAHLVGEHVLSRFSERGEYRRVGQQILLSLLGESFATTVELMGSTLATTPTHRLFYLLNSYLRQDFPYTASLRLTIARHGFSPTAQFVCISFLFANLLQDQAPRQAIDFWSHRLFGACSSLERRGHERLFRRAFQLSPKFREETTAVHFRMLGQERQLEALRARDPLQSGLSVLEPLQALVELLEAT